MNIKQFVIENINVDKDLWDKALRRVENIKQNLTGLSIDRFDTQGSFSRKTVVRPKTKDGEFDVDIVAIKNQINTIQEFRQYSYSIWERLDKRYEHVSTFGAKPSKATNVKYSKEFHIDIVPLRVPGDEYVYDTIQNTEYKSNPLQLTQGFNKIAKTHNNNSLRDTIKLIKYIRNLKAIEVPSIMFDIYYSQIAEQSSTYDGNVIALLRTFKDIPSTIINPYCSSEKISPKDPNELLKLKAEVEELIKKLSSNDFTGLKRAFKVAGAFIAPVSAGISAIALKASSGVGISSSGNKI